MLESYRGRVLPAAEAYRVWGERFFPVVPSRPTPSPVARKIVSVTKLSEALVDEQRDRPEHLAVQGAVARLGEVLLLTLDAREEGWGR